MPTKLKSGGELKFAKGNFSKGERFSHKAFNPDEYEVFSTKKFNPKENNSSPAKIRTVSYTHLTLPTICSV